MHEHIMNYLYVFTYILIDNRADDPECIRCCFTVFIRHEAAQETYLPRQIRLTASEAAEVGVSDGGRGSFMLHFT
jgi:hypothetical protein